MPTDHPPGFYRTNTAALSIRELIRWYGLFRLLSMYIATRRARPQSASWMPGSLAEMGCARENLTPGFWEFSAPARAAFEQLGFSDYAFVKPKPEKLLNPNLLDMGGIRYVHSNRSHIGGFVYLRQAVPHRNEARESLIAWFTVAFEKSLFSCSTETYSFNSRLEHKVVRYPSSDPAFLHERFLHHLRRYRKTPLYFPDNDTVRRYVDEEQRKAFYDRADRGIFVKMTDAEVEEFRRNMPTNA